MRVGYRRLRVGRGGGGSAYPIRGAWVGTSDQSWRYDGPMGGEGDRKGLGADVGEMTI